MPIERWTVISRNGEAGWSGRRKHQVVSHRDSLYLMGGYTSAGVIGSGNGPDGNLNDVWKSTEGAAWVRLLERAPWSGRDGHAALTHNGAIYLMGGTQDPRHNFSDVWRSVNGRDWVQVCRQAPWQGRWQHAALSYQGSMYVIGGWREGPGCLSDAWRSPDGVRWTKMCSSAPWGGRMFHSVVEANGAMYLLGGSNGRQKFNDCWVSTDGRDWNLVTYECQWCPRSGHASLCFENSMYVIGGEGSVGQLKDVWRSEDGAHWTMTEADVRVARQGHAALCHHGKALVFGGVSEGTVFMNDCLAGLTSAQYAAQAGQAPGRSLPPPSPLRSSRGHRGTPASALFQSSPATPSSVSTPISVANDLAVANGAVVVAGGSPLRRSDGSSSAVGGMGVGGGPIHRRHGSRQFSRHNRSVEEDLWGWFGDDRPASEASSSLLRVSSRDGTGVLEGFPESEEWGGGGGVAGGSDAEVTVSNLALTNRLAKLSDRRALLDQVRADNRSLSMVVSSAARAAFSPHAEADARASGGTARAVQFAPDVSPRQDQMDAAEEESTPGVPRTTPEAVVDGEENGVVVETVETDREGGGGDGGGVRRTVVEARAEIESLQGEIKLLVRQAGGDEERLRAARGEVSRLVARRTAVARATVSGARRMAQRLEEISEAQQSNRSNIDAAMRELERRARLAGGRVWRLIRGRSQQRDDENGGSGDGHANGVFPHAFGGVENGEPESPTASAVTNGDGGEGSARGRTWEWAVDRMRNRGSFFDVEELSTLREGDDVAGAEGGVRSGSGEILAPESTAKSFGELEKTVLGEEDGHRDRRETDECISTLRGAMEQHSQALARLSVWMARAPSAVPRAAAGESAVDGAVSVGGADASQPSDDGGVAEASREGRLSSLSQWAGSDMDQGGGVGGGMEERDGLLAMLELAKELDVLEGKVRRERYRAHRAVDVETYRTPGLYKEACALGNALILRGHDYLSQALADAGHDSSEAVILAEEANAWASRVAELADADELAAKGDALKQKIAEIRIRVLEKGDAVVDCQSAIDKKRRRGEELDELQADLSAAQRDVRSARRAGRKAEAAAAALAHGASPEIALDLPEALSPLVGRKQVVQDVSIANIHLPVRRLSEYENLRPMADEGSTGGGQGRHRIFLAEYDDETVVLKGYALVNALQRHSLARELHILDRIRHGAIIRAGAIVEDDGGADNPLPMLYIEFPYCSRGNLWQWLKSEQRQPWELQAAFRQVMCAVMHLHDRGVIHKDIKPGNVLVHADGRFLLADFDVSKDTIIGGGSDGVARDGGGGGARGVEIERTLSELETTRTSMAGTHGFMAPEVEAGRPSSLASDMYSLGALLFHMHFPDHPTGPLPIGEGPSGADLSVLSIPRDADPATVSLLKGLLAAEPDRRPTAADALQSDYLRVSHVSRLREDGALLEQTRKLEAVRSLFRNVRDEAKSAGPLKWTVKRDSRYLVPSVLELISRDAAGPALRQPLRITFEGEAGVDEGGILSEMYTLLFEAMMLPRFGMFEDCDAPPPASSSTSHSATAETDCSPGKGKKKDPVERAFAPRFTGMPPSAEAASSNGAGGGGGGGGGSGGPGNIHRDENFVYLEPAGVGREEHTGEDDEEESEEGEEDEGVFDVRQEAHRLMVESAASGVSGGGGLAGGGDGKSAGATFLPTARPSGYTDAQLRRYSAVGRAMVKCLFEGRRIGSRLAPSVFKFITGTATTVRDLQDFDPQTFESLKWMMANTGARDWGFHFEDIGQPDKGSVTEGNKAQYVSGKARLILVESRKPALEALKEGFARALKDISAAAAPFMGLLSHADWRVLLCGEEHVSGPQVVAVLTWYGFPARSEVPEWIKSLLLSLPEDALRRFLIFVCGTPSLPAPSAGKVEITVRCQPRSAALPAAHTCFFQLDVPDYDKESVLRHKLVQAVNNTASFDVV